MKKTISILLLICMIMMGSISVSAYTMYMFIPDIKTCDGYVGSGYAISCIPFGTDMARAGFALTRPVCEFNATIKMYYVDDQWNNGVKVLVNQATMDDDDFYYTDRSMIMDGKIPEQYRNNNSGTYYWQFEVSMNVKSCDGDVWKHVEDTVCSICHDDYISQNFNDEDSELFASYDGSYGELIKNNSEFFPYYYAGIVLR